jgi:pimeloyl-ACP methyl ester carboxylesterase
MRVRPKPVVLVHGWVALHNMWGHYTARSGDFAYLKNAHPDWYGFAVGDGREMPDVNIDSFPSPNEPAPPPAASMNTGIFEKPFAPTRTVAENAENVNFYIERLRTKLNAWHVDLISHSMGGMIGRQYIQDYMSASILEGPPGNQVARPVVHRYVQIAPSNDGSPCAELMFSALALGLFKFGHLATPYLPASGEVSKHGALFFNNRVTKTRGVPIDLVYGYSHIETCYELLHRGDMVISVDSAHGRDFGILGFSTDQATTHTHGEQWSKSTGQEVFGLIKPLLTNRRENDLPPGVPPAAASSASADAEDAAVDEVVPDAFFAESVTLPANGSADVAIPTPEADVLNVSMLSTAGVSSALFDPSGTQVDQRPVPTLPLPQSYSVADPASGDWRLHLTNPNDSAVDVQVGGAVAGNPLAVAADAQAPDTEGRSTLVATVTDGGSPVTNAQVDGLVVAADSSAVTEFAFTSNGDGTYSARTPKLLGGSSQVSVRARVGAATRVATVSVYRTPVHKLTLSTSGPGTAAVAEGTGPFLDGSTVTLTATAKPGHVFSSWVVDGSTRTENPLTLTMSDDRQVVARFDYKTPTSTTVTVTGVPSSIVAFGDVTPYHSGAPVDVSLYVKKGTKFKRIGQQSVQLDDASRYSVSLAAPSKGKCKVLVKFAGDVDHAASKATKVFPCGSPA